MTALNEPLALASGSVLPNRIAKSAMSERLAEPGGRPGIALVRLYRQWASGGAGLLITGNAMIDGAHTAEPGNVVIEDDGDLDGLEAWAMAARSDGAQVWVQLNHPGRQAPRSLDRHPVAPSAVPLALGGAFAAPRALTSEEIERLVQRFARSAALVQQAGFDGVQVHAAHGYLCSQFLSPLANHRTDAWGGDPERRRRFLLEVVRAVRAATGASFAVGVKLNSADFQKGGFSEEESMEVVRALEAEGIDLLEISGGTYEKAEMFREASRSTLAREAFFLDYARAVRGTTSVPLLLTGGFRTRAAMEAALSEGAIDVVGLARPLAVEPALPLGLLDGSRDAALEIRLAMGSKMLDGMVQGAWYQVQLARMGRGLEPSPGVWRARALMGYVADHLWAKAR